jgi:uncharacterized protein YndB with AHSA1/START domain
MTDARTPSSTALRLERTYAAPARDVFDAWTNPEVMRRWWHAGDDEWENTHAEADLRVGGALRVVMRDADGKSYGASGEYTEIDPPGRLAFTWTWDDEPGRSSLLELDFTEANGGTTVVLTHSGLASEQSRDGHREGWRETLDNLGRVVDA